MPVKPISLLLFDYGGVLAEEGYREGLFAIARANRLEPEEFFAITTEIIYGCGLVEGRNSEAVFWQLLRDRTGIAGLDRELRQEILDRFVLRPAMLDLVRRLRAAGFRTAILSDQTGWLDELNSRDNFFPLFDKVYNSYHIGRSKRRPDLFPATARDLGLSPAAILFIDDNQANIDHARQAGMHVHLFTSVPACMHAVAMHTGLPVDSGH